MGWGVRADPGRAEEARAKGLGLKDWLRFCLCFQLGAQRHVGVSGIELQPLGFGVLALGFGMMVCAQCSGGGTMQAA